MTATQGHCLDVLASMASGSARCCVTSPPYWGLRDYGTPPVHWPAVTFAPMAGLPTVTIPEQDASLGLEPDPWAYVGHLVSVFREVRRVLAADGALWLNLGDSYASCAGGYDETGSAGTTSTAIGAATKAAVIKGRVRSPPGGLKPKDLLGIPWRVAFALQADGWWLRSDVVWAKPNPMPESVTDRPTKAHEMVFLLTKSARYFYDADAIAEPVIKGDSGSTFTEGKTGINGRGRQQSAASRRKQDGAGGRRYEGFNARWDASEEKGTAPTNRNVRSVWTIATEPCPDAHFAVMPSALAERCVLAGSEVDDVVLDPFAGAGTTLATARRLGRKGIGCELNPDYIEIQGRRIEKAGGYQVPLLGGA